MPFFLLSSSFLFFELVGAGGFGVFNGERNHVIWETMIKEQDDNKKKGTCLTRGNKKKKEPCYLGNKHKRNKMTTRKKAHVSNHPVPNSSF